MAFTAAIFGTTGLTGSHILTTLLEQDAWKSVYTFSRRAPKAPESPKLNATIESDTTKWAAQLKAITPAPETVFSALGTTRAEAGGIQNQWKIDHDLNVELAKAAKEAGARTYVFVSSGATRGLLGRQLPYSQMKIGVEDAIRDLGFEQAVVLRPGALLGPRDKPHSMGPALNAVFRSLGYLGQGVMDTLAVEGDVAARAAVHAATLASQGKAPQKFWVLELSDIIRLGRDEWKA
ncbi:NAD(P)-binding protein [Xylariomycetidae sp. FL0641]|nr:NAD(P)-binding protein [Xylariomycetidae sp. FL0641]KAI0026152.1 NAD(P)-binding protein [Xylariomycetidae sp. FL0641]